MRDPDEFDAFYKSARGRLLLQTYALTGDVPASRSAVRDSFVVAWHHWRKVGQLGEPEEWVRPHAWRHAQRRATARLWHRDKALDTDIRATLDALGKLSVTQRKTLLLTQLAAVSMPQMAREVGLPLDAAERQLQQATAQFAVARDVPSTEITPLFVPLAEIVGDAAWPRSTIIRRAGAARRRTHTTVGSLGAVAILLASGALITDANGVRPTLDRVAVAKPIQPVEEPEQPQPPAPEAEEVLPERALLSAEQVGGFVNGKGWIIGRSSDNSEGNGLAAPCQLARYADPRGRAAWVRTFRSVPTRDDPHVSALQLAEASRSGTAARRAYQATLGWYAGCAVERTQLLATRQVAGVGDQAMLLVLRTWDAPVSTIVVGVARTGMLTTATLSRVNNERKPDVVAAATMLAAAVDGLCELPDAGACAGAPKPTVVPPVPIGKAPGMLAEVDLPPVAEVNDPWVGTQPRRALRNNAATRCDDTEFIGDFGGVSVTNNLTRTFLVPGAKLPDVFGLTQSVGTLPVRRAAAFVEQVRRELAACPDDDLGTEVVRLRHLDEADRDLTVWQVTTEISDEESVRFMMAILRRGTALAQIGFVPTDDSGMRAGAFDALALRALDRLAQMPPPR